MFHNAVQQFWDLGLVLKFLALVNPCAQQRGSLSSLSGEKKGKKKKEKLEILGRAKVELESPDETEVRSSSTQW